MIVRIGLLRKKPDWSIEAFRRYWLEKHGPLAARLPALRHYEQNHVVDNVYSERTRGPDHIDGFSELTFESDDAMRAETDTQLGQDLARDEAHFIDALRVAVVEQHVCIATDWARSPIKRMALLRRRPEVSAEQFAREWLATHAALVREMPGVRGHRQNLVLARQAPKGTPVDHAGMPVDGIAELWFDDAEAMYEAFVSVAGREATRHSQTFVAETTPFLVKRHVVVQRR